MKYEIDYKDGLMTVKCGDGTTFNDVAGFSIEGGNPDIAQVSMTYYQGMEPRQSRYLDGTERK
jgi:hypothetical protein